MEKKSREQRIADILDAVIECKSNTEGQYVQTSLVAARAGVSTRTLNRYFPDYNLMIFEAMSRYLDRKSIEIVSRYKKLNLEGLNGRQRLIAFLNEQIRVYQENIPETITFIEANIRCIAIGMEKLYRRSESNSAVSDIIRMDIETGIQDHSIQTKLSSEDITLLISANFNGLMQRLLFLYRTQADAYGIEEIIMMMREYVNMVEGYLKP